MFVCVDVEVNQRVVYVPSAFAFAHEAVKKYSVFVAIAGYLVREGGLRESLSADHTVLCGHGGVWMGLTVFHGMSCRMA